MVSALILIANGTEEMEYTITYDTLVRGGVNVKSALVNDHESTIPGPSPVAKCSRGVKIIADYDLADVEDLDSYDAVIVPGGMKGAKTLAASEQVQKLVKGFYDQGKVVGMICAGPLVALSSGIPKAELTSHPDVKSELAQAFDYSEKDIVVSKNLITSRGPGTSFGFALKLVEVLQGKDMRDKIYTPMVFPPGYYAD